MLRVRTFRTLHSSQPAYLCSSLHACHSTRSLRLSKTNLLSAPFVHTSFGTRSFSVAAHKIWNSLPLSLRTCTSSDTFRRHLKTHYCQQAFQSTVQNTGESSKLYFIFTYLLAMCHSWSLRIGLINVSFVLQPLTIIRPSTSPKRDTN